MFVFGCGTRPNSRKSTADVGEETVVVEPGDPFQGGGFEVFEAAPDARRNEFSLTGAPIGVSRREGWVFLGVIVK